ncbi:MAG: RlmE family RNA methyltransferase [Candidatus Thorarchaeota archaeon]
MTNNHKRDPYYKKAKKEGFRARSAFKLLDIQKRFNIFKRAFYILDLGCAPGSWLQVTRRFAEDNLNKYNNQYYHRDHYKILGVDVKKVTPIENVDLLIMDFTTTEFCNNIQSYFQSKIDLIISDASIKKTGNKFSDHLKQINLCYKILEIAKNHLKHKGVLVLKTFQGSDFNKLVAEVKKEFRILKTFKPKSSRKKSNEIYLIGLQKK